MGELVIITKMYFLKKERDRLQQRGTKCVVAFRRRQRDCSLLSHTQRKPDATHSHTSVFAGRTLVSLR